jgi:hypothetical protein
LKIHGELEEVAITKVVPNYTFFLHKFYGGFSHPLAIFLGLNQFWQLILSWKINYQWSTYRPPHFRSGLPVGGCWARRCHAPTDFDGAMHL